MNYAKGSMDGTIGACQAHKWMVERFYRDLEDERYYADWDELLKFNRWAGMFKHTKGVIAGQRIELVDHQLFLFMNILGIKRVADGFRKYKEAYIQLGRKNAKSQDLALLVSYVAFLSEEQEEVYISSWTRDQSSLVYNESLSQIRQVDMLKGRFSDSYGMIRVRNNGSIIKPLSREARKTGDGTNPSIAVLDEYKDNLTSELRDTQKTGMMARKNPLLVVITTAGFDLNVPCHSDYQYYKRVLNPEDDAENDEVFIAIYELDEGDDVKDESNWIKANPILATYERGMEALRADLKSALEQPERMRAFLTKNMNLWIDSKEDGYMELSKWNKAEVSPSEMEVFMEGANVYLGIDLSMTTDLTAVGWVAVKNGKFMVGQHSFMPEGKYKERMSRDKVRFDIFKERNELTLTYGDVVDYNYVKKWVIGFASKYNVIQIGYDKWNATHFAQELLNDGYPMIEIPQSVTQLSEPTKRFRENVYSGTVVHLGDRLLKWSISNAVLKEDQQENVMIGKQVSKDRIDPVAAIINAFARAMYDDQVVDLNEHILSDDFSF